MTNPYGWHGGPQPWGQHEAGFLPAGSNPQGGFAPPQQQPYIPPPEYGQYRFGPPPSYAPPPPPPPPKRKSRTPWIVGALLAALLAAIVLVLGFVTPGLLIKTVFDADGVGKGVRQILHDSYRLDGVQSVSCPADQPVKASHSFDCRVTIGGQPQLVTVTVTDADGRYEVSRPKAL